MTTDYRPRREPRRETLTLRGLDTGVTRWGESSAVAEPPVVLLHGWQDTADTFQFMVDAFTADLPCVALDWRGFGRSEWPQDGYWFPNYLADFDAFLEVVSPTAAVKIVGHSMGGNVASLYAGLRPERVRCVANLEGFGLPRAQPSEAPAQLRKWLEQVKLAPASKAYRSIDELTALIRFRYPRFSDPQCGFIARAWSTAKADGSVELLGDPRHRWASPLLYKREDAEACWRELRAPILMLLAEESEYLTRLGADGTDDALRALMPHLQIERVADAGHMLHIEQPQVVASLVERFLAAH